MADAKVVNSLKIVLNGLVHTHYALSKYVGDLRNYIGKINSEPVRGRNGVNRSFLSPKERKDIHQHMVRVSQTVAGLGNLINTFKTQVVTVAKPGLVIASTTQELVKIAGELDEAGEHMLADCVDDIARSIQHAKFSKKAALTPNVLQELEEAQMSLLNWSQMAQMNEYDRKQLRAKIFRLNKAISGALAGLKSTGAGDSEEMLRLASYLDNKGFHKLASKVDRSILKMANYGFIPRTRKIGQEIEVVEPIQQPREGSLSTRYCPDHIGVQTFRVSERTYQCPIDGRIYNYEAGYKNYQGQRVPGGSVAAQTPTTTNYGGIPMRIYDSRQSILNRMN